MDAMDATSLEDLFFLNDAMNGGGDEAQQDAQHVPLQFIADAFPPSPPPSSMQSNLMMPNAPSPSLHLDPMQTSASLASNTSNLSTAKSSSKKKAAAVSAIVAADSSSPMSTAMMTAKLQKLSAAKKFLTLDDVEREILRHNAHLPPDAKRKMAKAEFKRLKHCETVRQSRVRKKVMCANLDLDLLVHLRPLTCLRLACFSCLLTQKPPGGAQGPETGERRARGGTNQEPGRVPRAQ